MKLVAASNFRNTVPAKIEIEGALHPLHVHKGARFTIGGDMPFEKLTASDRQLVAGLNIAGRIVDADSQPDKVRQIDREVADAAKVTAKPAAK